MFRGGSGGVQCPELSVIPFNSEKRGRFPYRASQYPIRCSFLMLNIQVCRFYWRFPCGSQSRFTSGPEVFSSNECQLGSSLARNRAQAKPWETSNACLVLWLFQTHTVHTLLLLQLLLFLLFLWLLILLLLLLSLLPLLLLLLLSFVNIVIIVILTIANIVEYHLLMLHELVAKVKIFGGKHTNIRFLG